MINTFSVLLNQIGSKEQETLMKSSSVFLWEQCVNRHSSFLLDGEVKISDYIISDFETERVEVKTICKFKSKFCLVFRHWSQTSGNKKNNDTVKFLQNQNHRSLVREYLLSQFQSISLPTTIEELILLSSTINQLTETTCEWTRKSIVRNFSSFTLIKLRILSLSLFRRLLQQISANNMQILFTAFLERLHSNKSY